MILSVDLLSLHLIKSFSDITSAIYIERREYLDLFDQELLDS